MSNYIDKFTNIQTINTNVFHPQKSVKGREYRQDGFVKKENFGTNILERYLQNNGSIISAAQVKPINYTQNILSQYKNDLKTKFENNDAVIMGVVIRSFGAKDNVGNQLIREGDTKGTLVNAVERLKEVKNLGINTFHVLPIHPPGKENAYGTAGSVYAPEKFIERNGELAIDPEIIDENPPIEAREAIAKIYKEKTGKELVKMDKNDQSVRYAQFKYFVNECHKNGINVMLDLPSCASYDLYKAHPELMAKEKDGTPKTPGGWNDIRMFAPFEDETKRTLNKPLLDMHLLYGKSCIEDFGIDGIRADVSRAKPPEFWDIAIDYFHKLDPEFAMLGETYTKEDASPQINMPYDNPEDAYKSKFQAVYGQYHITHEMDTASKITDYIKETIDMTNKCGRGKSVIGSFGTHDDVSIMNHGGVIYTNFVSGLQATLPKLNPYYFDGYQSGDDYMYDFEGMTDNETVTDSNECTVHKSKPDIFNNSRPLIGKHPEIGDFMKSTLDIRSNPKYHDILTKGSFIPLKVDGNKKDQILAYIRHLNGKTLLFVANRDVNTMQSGSIEIPGLKGNQKLQNLFPSYGDNSILQAEDGKINVELGKGRVHLFEINTPNIENSGLEVLKAA